MLLNKCESLFKQMTKHITLLKLKQSNYYFIIYYLLQWYHNELCNLVMCKGFTMYYCGQGQMS